MRKLSVFILLMTPLLLFAQNPIITGQFCADPTARVFNNKVYVYPSHDIPSPVERLKDWFCMADYHVFSSDNLMDWQDHGVIITQNKVPWVQPDSYSMWAPDCVCKNGKYYFYFPSSPKGGGRGFAIGVATADRPEGPFVCEQEPIKGVSGIDPCVLVDDDGSAYLYWSGMGIRGAKLKDNMKELDGELTEMQMPARPNNNNQQGDQQRERPKMLVGGQQMEGLPDGFKEGPHAFKRGSWYYLTFPWVRVENGTETLAYAMSKSPLGPWTFKGIFMAEHPNGCWTNHHSFMEFKGQWYLFYHSNDYSPNMDKRRSTRIEKVFFNADGTIKEVKETMRGVGVRPATDKIEIDRYSEASNGVTTEYLDTTNYFRGWSVNLPNKGSWVKFTDVDFGTLSDGYVVVRAKTNANTEFQVREKSANGKVIAKIQMTVKSENGPFRRDMSGQWLTLTAPLEYTPQGITDLVVTGEGVSVDWVQFKNRPKYFSPMGNTAATPDDKGFIRRWMLLDPIDKPNRSNTVFTDTYLRENFYQNYFKDQMSILPKDGQKVKAGKQTLTWHALDSDKFNVKLFRFADANKKQVYGVLFWAVTVIDCPEDIENVRLAVGSNSASMWWLNGEEVLLLSGDRRMVEDDAMSNRLTLKKGRNVLRGAVINGPGMSDFCVRFLDEKGNPVKNFTIQPQK